MFSHVTIGSADPDKAAAFFEGDEPLHAICSAMDELGLGYLGLGHASNRLSRGEAQRVKLATLLGTRAR